MASKWLGGMLDKVMRRGGAAVPAAAAAPRPRPVSPLQAVVDAHEPGPPPRKLRPPTLDGRSPQSPDDIDPELLAELYKMGPALKTESAMPAAPDASDAIVESRRTRFDALGERDGDAPRGRLTEPALVKFLSWRGAGSTPDAAGLARALGGGDDAELLADALVFDLGSPQIQTDRGAVRVGLWAPGSAALELEAAENPAPASPPPSPPPLPGRRPRP